MYRESVDKLTEYGVPAEVARRCVSVAAARVGSFETVDTMSMAELLEASLPLHVDVTQLFDGDFAWLSDTYKRTPKKQRAQLLEDAGNVTHRRFPYRVRGDVLSDLWVVTWYVESTLRERIARDKPLGIAVLEDQLVVPTKISTHVCYRMVCESEDDDVVVLEDAVDDDSLVQDGDVIMRFKGTVLVDDTVSVSGRVDPPLYYSRSGNDAIMSETNDAIESNGPLTLYCSHEAYLSGNIPFGMVKEPLFRVDDRIMYYGLILNTEMGRDIAVLIRNRVLRRSSLRSYDVTIEQTELAGGKPVSAVVRGVLSGIDLTETPGISGAEISYESQEDNMDYSVITLDDLQKQRPDLVTALLESVAPDKVNTVVFEDRLQKLVEENKTLRSELDAVAPRINDLEATLKQLHDTEARNALVASLTEGVEFGDLVANELLGSTHTLEDLQTNGPAIVESVVATYKRVAAQVQSKTTFVGMSETTDDDSTDRSGVYGQVVSLLK